jgi:F-type H+-transporting ATPase subunit b
MVVLVYLLYRPIQGILAQRTEKISNDLSEAQKSKETWEQKQKEAKLALEKASAEALEMVERARQEAEKMREEIVGKARQEAEELRQRNQAEIERAKKAAQNELREGAVALAISAASKAIGSKMSAEINESLIRGVLSSIEKGA